MRQPPVPVAAPRLVRLNVSLAGQLGLDADYLRSVEGLQLLAGNCVPEGSAPLAMAYAGHQFGQFVPQLVQVTRLKERARSWRRVVNGRRVLELEMSKVEQLTSLIEPIMIGVMGFLVGGMVLAIFLPIFKLQASLQQ